MSSFEAEVKKGERFEFGKNWQRFLSALTDERIRIAETSIKKMIGTNNLSGTTLLDIGSGSGLFSLAARNLGANVHSFDYDPTCVACTRELRSRYFPNDPNWSIEEGSVLDEMFVQSLGSFDIVYAWGVLHHTGNMWSAVEKACSLVKRNGVLFIAIYNDQGKKSSFWKNVKRLYCSGILGKTIASCIFIPYFFSITLVSCVLKRENLFAGYRKNRGMTITHDWFDWLGGFPFEVATADEVLQIVQEKGYRLRNIKATNGIGNNQFVFVRESES